MSEKLHRTLSGTQSDMWPKKIPRNYSGSVLVAGDSISVEVWGGVVTGGTTLPLNQFPAKINTTYSPHLPLVQNCAKGGTKASDALITLPGQLAAYSQYQICILAFGTNDAGNAVGTSVYQTNMTSLVNLVIAAGMTPVIPTIPYASQDPWHTNIPAYNAIVTGVLQGLGGVRAGPDLYTWVQANQGSLQGDGVHFTEAGCEALIQLWVTSMSWAYP